MGVNKVALWVVPTSTAPVDFWHSVGVCTGLEVTVTFIVNPSSNSSNFIFTTSLVYFGIIRFIPSLSSP